MKKFIINSSFFMFFPVIAAAWVHEWVYSLIAFGASVCSPIYHSLKEYHFKDKTFVSVIRSFDWLFAILAYFYMFYFIFARVDDDFVAPLSLALSLTIIFFWYGFKFGSYHKFHPWFHIITSLVSGIIVLSI